MDLQGSQGNFQVGPERNQDIPESFQVDVEGLEVLEDHQGLGLGLECPLDRSQMGYWVDGDVLHVVQVWGDDWPRQ